MNAHILITLLAYLIVHSLRVLLREKGICLSWDGIRNTMVSQQRVSATMPTEDGGQVYVRSTTKAEPVHQKIYGALGVKADSLGARKSVQEAD